MISDEKLIRKITRHNDRQAANELFERYYRKVYAYVFRQCGERELAMELTQDIFMAVFQGLHSFDGKRAAFGTWMYRVAANKITDYYRSRRYREGLREVSLEDREAEFPQDEDIVERLSQRETLQQIMEIVAGYDLTWVRIFQMKCFEEKTFAEIARALNLPDNTVKSRYYAMIRQIKKRYGE